nr:uncharacterized protein LOC110141199 isoform X5 [Odocoileus virginianus texanus]
MTGGVESGPHPENCRPCFLRTSAFFTTASPGMWRKWKHIFSRSHPRTSALETKCDLPAGARGGPLESGAGTSPRF